MFEALLEAFTLPNTAINTDSFLISLEEQQNRQVPQNQSNLKIEFQVSFIILTYYSYKLCLHRSQEKQVKAVVGKLQSSQPMIAIMKTFLVYLTLIFNPTLYIHN